MEQLQEDQLVPEKVDNQHGVQTFILNLHLVKNNGKENGNGNLEHLNVKEDVHFHHLMTFLEDRHLLVLHPLSDGNGIKNKKEDNGWNGNGQMNLEGEGKKKRN